MTNKKEKTAPNISVGADTEQSIQKNYNDSINYNDEKIKCSNDFLKKQLYQ